MNRLNELKREQNIYLSKTKKQIEKARKEIKASKLSSFNAELDYGTRDLSRIIEKEERNLNAVEYNKKILHDYMEKTGKSVLEAMNDVRHLFKKVI